MATTLGVTNIKNSPLQNIVLGSLVTPIGVKTSVVLSPAGYGSANINAPWMHNDFSQYSGLGDIATGTGVLGQLFYDRYYNTINGHPGFWGHQNDDISRDAFQLMQNQSDGPPGGSSQYLRYNWLGWAQRPCSSYSISLESKYTASAQEIYGEVWARFASNFSTGEHGSCVGAGNNDQKFLLRGVISPLTPCNRFGTDVGNGGVTGQLMTTGAITTVWPGDPVCDRASTLIKPNEYFEGNWHRWRFRDKLSPLNVPQFVATQAVTLSPGTGSQALVNTKIGLINTSSSTSVVRTILSVVGDVCTVDQPWGISLTGTLKYGLFLGATGATVLYFDNKLVCNFQNINAFGDYLWSCRLGANNNYGPPVATTEDWGIVNFWAPGITGISPGWTEPGF